MRQAGVDVRSRPVVRIRELTSYYAPTLYVIVWFHPCKSVDVGYQQDPSQPIYYQRKCMYN
jgi:hypothetical protein